MKPKAKFSVLDGGKGKPRPKSPKVAPNHRVGFRKNPFYTMATDDPHSLESYLVAATDGQGHSVTLGTCVPPSIKRTADVILARGRFGFKTMGDLVRWCVKNGLGELAKISSDPEIKTAYDILRPLLHAQGMEMARREYEQQIAGMKTLFDSLIRDGNIRSVRVLQRDIERAINSEEIPEHWKGRWRVLFIDGYKWVDKRIRELEEGG